MKVGIVGMPNAGKSSLFNALTQAGAEAANYPFTTIEPNVAVVPGRGRAPATRSPRRSAPRTSSTTRSTSTTSPASSRGAHEGEGLGNQFLANIRETDAIVHVVRAHHDANVIHPDGQRRPAARHRDDRDRARSTPTSSRPSAAIERVVRQARGGDSAAIAEEALAARRSSTALQAGRPARTVPVPEDAPDALRDLAPADRQAGAVRGQRRRGRRRGPARDRRARRRQGAVAVAVSSRIEAELSELDDEDAAAMRADLGVAESGLQRVVARRLRAARPARVLHRRRGQAGAVVAPAPRA